MKFDNVQELTIRNGFPIQVHFNVSPAEPDVGISQRYVEDYQFTNIKGKSIDWLKLTKQETDYLLERLNISGD